MRKIKLPSSSEFIVLAPRFEVNESGHFYWFTKSLERELISNDLPYRIISGAFDGSSQKQFESWMILPTRKEWGKDTGTISPLRLAKLIETEILIDTKQSSRSLIYTYETSYSLLAALIIILLRRPNSTAAANMLDTGYWQRFFDWEWFSWAPLRSSVKYALKSVDKRLLLYANMPNHAAIISKQINYSVDVFPHISALNPKEYANEDFSNILRDEKLPKILILTWPGDLPFVCRTLKLMSQKHPMLLQQITVHTKNSIDDSVMISYLSLENIKGINLVTGTLSDDSYKKLIRQNDVTLFPYSDEMHFSTGSGRVIDSLVLGRPVILNSESGSCLHANKVNACFTFDGISPSSLLEAIEKFQLSPFFAVNSAKKEQDNLESAAGIEFSIGGMLGNIISGSEERMGNTKTGAHVRKIDIALVILIFEVTWHTLAVYNEFSLFIQRALKFLLRRGKSSK